MKRLLHTLFFYLTLLLLAACIAPLPAQPPSSPAPSAIQTKGPTNPQRIIAQDFLGELLALGITPVGTPDRFFDEAQLYRDYLQGVERIGDANNIDLEKVALLNPDLILVNQYLPAGTVTALQEIAPVISLDDNEEAMQRLRTVAEIVGKSEEAEVWIEQYTQKQEETRQAVAALIKPGEKALILTMWEDIIWVQATRSVGHTIYNTVGFSPTTKIESEVATIMSGANTGGQSGYLEISLELLPEYAADADRIFLLLSADEASQERYQSYLENPLWQSLAAVQNDHVYLLNTNWGWYNPIGLEWELEGVVKLLAQ